MDKSATEAKPLKKETWFDSRYRPALAWSYLVVCVFDFMLGPILNGVFAYITSTPLVSWTPLTVQAGALYHIAMLSIITATAWGRTKEKLAAMGQTEDK